jgi:hypothetical protein
MAVGADDLVNEGVREQLGSSHALSQQLGTNRLWQPSGKCIGSQRSHHRTPSSIARPSSVTFARSTSPKRRAVWCASVLGSIINPDMSSISTSSVTLVCSLYLKAKLCLKSTALNDVSSNLTGSSPRAHIVRDTRLASTPSKAKLSDCKSIGSSTTHHQTRGSSTVHCRHTPPAQPPLKGSRVCQVSVYPSTTNSIGSVDFFDDPLPRQGRIHTSVYISEAASCSKSSVRPTVETRGNHLPSSSPETSEKRDMMLDVVTDGEEHTSRRTPAGRTYQGHKIPFD